MQITEVRINLKEASNNKLKAFATITIDDCFVVRDIKIIDGKRGLFVAMPSSRISGNCPHCNRKTPVRSRFCGECGKRMSSGAILSNVENRREEHRDIAHPINAQCRDYIQSLILKAYHKEQELRSNNAYAESSMV